MNFASILSVWSSSIALSAYLLLNPLIAMAETNPIFDRTCNFAEALVQRFEGASELKSTILPEIDKLKATSACPGWWLPPSQDDTSVQFLLSKIIRGDKSPFHFSDEEAWSVVQILRTGEASFLQKIFLEKRINISRESITGSGLFELISSAVAQRFDERERESIRVRIMFELRRMLSGNYSDLTIYDLTAKLRVALDHAIGIRFGSQQAAAQLPIVMRNVLVQLVKELDPTNPWLIQENLYCKDDINFFESMLSRCKNPVKLKDLIDYQRIVKNATAGGQL